MAGKPDHTPEPSGEGRLTEPGIVTIGDEVVYDGEAAALGVPSRVAGAALPSPDDEDPIPDDEIEDDTDFAGLELPDA